MFLRIESGISLQIHCFFSVDILALTVCLPISCNSQFIRCDVRITNERMLWMTTLKCFDWATTRRDSLNAEWSQWYNNLKMTTNVKSGRIVSAKENLNISSKKSGPELSFPHKLFKAFQKRFAHNSHDSKKILTQQLLIIFCDHSKFKQRSKLIESE